MKLETYKGHDIFFEPEECFRGCEDSNCPYAHIEAYWVDEIGSRNFYSLEGARQHINFLTGD